MPRLFFLVLFEALSDPLDSAAFPLAGGPGIVPWHLMRCPKEDKTVNNTTAC